MRLSKQTSLNTRSNIRDVITFTYKYLGSLPKYLIFIHVIHLKSILLEGMTLDVADTIFSKFGVQNASELDKGNLKDYYIALVKKHHPDKGGKDEDMRYINAAYDVLKVTDSADTSGDSNLYNGRTVPKGKTKARLQKVNVQFRFDDETVIASGKSDYFDLIKIFQRLKLLRISVMFDPNSPYDEMNEKWNTNNVLIYAESKIRSREYIINIIRSGCKSYF